MFHARLKRLEGAVDQVVNGEFNKLKLISCLEEATHLCQQLESQRDALGKEISQVKKSRSAAQTYIQTIEYFNKRGS